MFIDTRKFRRLLKSGRPTFGAFLMLGSPAAAEVLSLTGLDWVIIDGEHSPVGFETAQLMLQAMSGSSITPFMRVAVNDAPLIKRALDIGVHGVLVPLVNTREEAEAAVAAVRYPPEGIRGIAPLRASRYWTEYEEYLKGANRQILCMIQIEHIHAVDRIEEICDVKGVDVIFVGPADLSGSMGLTGQRRHPEVIEAINRVRAVTKRKGIPLATVSVSPDDARNLVKEGYNLISLGHDDLFMMSGCRAILDHVRRDDTD